MMRIASAAVVVVCLSALLQAAAQGVAPVEKGKAVYATHKCQTCHAIDGVGNKRFPLDGVGKKLSAKDTSTWITHPAEMEAKLPTKPKVRMPAYKLAADDLEALVAYMQSLK